MSSPFHLSTLSSHDSPYRKPSDIWNAVAWSTMKKYLLEQWVEKVFLSIRGVRIERSTLIITTRDALISQELRIRQEDILSRVNTGLSPWWGRVEKVQIR